MYSIIVYFSNKNIEDMLIFLNIINEEFSKIFGIKYKGLSINNFEEIMKLREGNMIYGVAKKYDCGPYHDIQFWDDSFAISVEIYDNCFEDGFDMDEKFFKNIKVFMEVIGRKISILAMHAGDGDGAFNDGWRAFKRKEIEAWVDFGYFDGKFFLGKSHFSQYYE